jgi:hypothetical protein
MGAAQAMQQYYAGVGLAGRYGDRLCGAQASGSEQ